MRSFTLITEMRMVMKKFIYVFFILFFITLKASAFEVLSDSEKRNINIRATQFATNMDIESWKIKLNKLVETKYIDNCGEKRFPKKGINDYCKYYYTYIMAKERGYQENLPKKYKEILKKTYEIANSDNSDFNDFILDYGDDKIAYNDILNFKNICDEQYKNNKFLGNSCIINMANKTQNPFNRITAFCYYGLSKVKKDDGVSYRELDQNNADNCYIQLQQNHDEFLIWEIYMGYKMGASLAIYSAKNNIFDFLLDY